MMLITGYAVRHKKFKETGSIVEHSDAHIKIQWSDGRTCVYSKTFAKEILERV